MSKNAAMLLPDRFRLSQSALNDYNECPHRFFLRYIERRSWPAPVTAEADRFEEAARRGRLFHDLVQQNLLGLDVEAMVKAEDDDDLHAWWANYRDHAPDSTSASVVRSEVVLAAPLGPVTLVAKYDRLLLFEDGRAEIIDWKTGRARPKHDRFRDSWQSLVYPYVLVEAGANILGGRPLHPEKVTMTYWHAAHPHDPTVIRHSREAQAEARKKLEHAIDELAAKQADDFTRTDDPDVCTRCVYRSLCGRGREAAAAFDETKLDEDIDQIIEDLDLDF